MGRSVFLLAYGLLYDQLEPFPCTAEGCRRILDVHAGSEQRSGCAALYGQLRFEVDVDALKVCKFEYAANPASRSRHMADATGLKGLCTLSRQCTIRYKFMIRVDLSGFTAIGTKTIYRCHPSQQSREVTTQAAFKSLFSVVNHSIDFGSALVKRLEALVAIHITDSVFRL